MRRATLGIDSLSRSGAPTRHSTLTRQAPYRQHCRWYSARSIGRFDYRFAWKFLEEDIQLSSCLFPGVRSPWFVVPLLSPRGFRVFLPGRFPGCWIVLDGVIRGRTLPEKNLLLHRFFGGPLFSLATRIAGLQPISKHSCISGTNGAKCFLGARLQPIRTLGPV